jgi:DNA-binding NtrC family response regulator
MRERVSALLVHQQTEPLRSLRLALERQAVATARAQNCQEAWRILSGANAPHLIFTDTAVPDGLWTDVLALAAQAPQPVNVIVVARLVDTRLYIEAIEAGAFDFLAPPFTAADLAHVVRCAVDNVLARREAEARVDESIAGKLFPAFSAPGFASTRRDRSAAHPAAKIA